MLAALYGGLIALSNSLLLGRRVRNLAVPTTEDGKQAVTSLYVGALQRFVLTVLAMSAGMGLLGLDPLSLVATFAAAQIAYVVASGPRLA